MRLDRWFWGLEAFSLFAIVLSTLAMAYLFATSYMEYANIEPMVAVGAQQWLHGYPLYTAIPGPDCYSSLYGPTTYLLTAAGLELFPDPIFGSKFAGVALSLFTTVLFTCAVKRVLPWSETLFALGLFCVQSLMLGEFCFGMAANPFLTMVAVMGLLSSTFSSWTPRIALLAVATGLAQSTKFHGALYLLPAWVLLLHEGGLWRSVQCGLFSLGVFLAPYCLPGISLERNMDWVRAATHHPKLWGSFWNTVIAELWFGSLVMILLAVPRKIAFWSLPNRTYQMALGLFLGFLVILIPASYDGAGPHHLWPFMPWISYILASWLHSTVRRTTSIPLLHGVRIGLFGWTLTLALLVPFPITSFVDFLRADPQRVLVETDLRNILSRYPKVPLQMGYGGDASFPLTYLRPLVYQRPNRCLVDGVAAGEFFTAGVSLQPLLNAMLSHRDNLWLIPKNETPFTMTCWYRPRRRIFPQELVDEFLTHYRKTDSSTFFDIYSYKP